MSRLIIEVPDDELNQAKFLLEKLNWKTIQEAEPVQQPDSRKALAALQSLADKGGVTSIPDPSAWQRKIRKDRPLPGREE